MPLFKVIVNTPEGKKKVVVKAPNQAEAEKAAIKECKNV